MPTTILRTRDGKLDAQDRQTFEALKARLKTGGEPVLIHLHGGLVTQAAGEDTARRLAGAGVDAYNAPANFEQVYVVWRTGLLETVGTNWRDLFENDNLYRALFKKMLKYAASRVNLDDGSGRSLSSTVELSETEIEARLASGSDAPFADLDERIGANEPGRSVGVAVADEDTVEAEVTAIFEFDSELEAIASSIAAAAKDTEGGRGPSSPADAAEGAAILARLDPDVENELVGEADEAGQRGLITFVAVLKGLVKHGARIAWRVISRFRNGRDHGLHATVIEEILRELYGDRIGAPVWQMMKTDAADHFHDNAMGAELVDALVGSDRKVIVVGHSAGSIWAGAFLEAATQKDSFPKVDLLLLAPAVRSIEFADVAEKASNLIGKFRIFTMADMYERRDPVLGKGTGAIYPSSLLYLISGILERRDNKPFVDAPVLGMQRFIHRDPAWIGEEDERNAMATVRSYLSSNADSVVYSVIDGGPGLSSSATSHSGFDDDEPTLKSIASFF